MVKLPQSALGYAVNGKVVSKPTDRAQLKATVTDRRKPSSKKLVANKGINKDKPFHNKKISVVRFDGVLEDLKNASMQGDHLAAMEVLNDVARGNRKDCQLWDQLRQWQERRKYVDFICMVHLLFVTSYKNRSAIYLAALCGHEVTVQVYLSLLVWCRLCMAPSRYKAPSQKLTFAEWIDMVGYLPVFDQRDFHLCVQNALNLSIRDVFMRNTYSADDIKLFAKSNVGPLFVEYVPVPALPRILNKRTPRLVLDDEFTVNYADKWRWRRSQHETWRRARGGAWTPARYYTWTENDGDEIDNKETASDSDGIALTVVQDEQLPWAYPNIPKVSTEEEQVGELFIEIDIVSRASEYVCDGYHVSFSGDEELSSVDTAIFAASANEEWDVVSDLASVISLDTISVPATGPVSYRDMLMRRSPITTETERTRNNQENKNEMETMAKVSEVDEEKDPEFDCYFMMEGVKGTRGGKLPFILNGKAR